MLTADHAQNDNGRPLGAWGMHGIAHCTDKQFFVMVQFEENTPGSNDAHSVSIYFYARHDTSLAKTNKYEDKLDM